jgi:hypothetical protein
MRCHILIERSITGYIGDLKDGVHKGDKNDPRVAVIEVIPDEIKYWITKHSSAVRTAQVAYGAATGKATAPGELRIISKEEVSVHVNEDSTTVYCFSVGSTCARTSVQVNFLSAVIFVLLSRWSCPAVGSEVSF